MSDFPVDPLSLQVELFLDETWQAMSGSGPLGASNRLISQSISIKRGRSDEASQVAPADATFVLWNGDGYLTSYDRRSPVFGQWDLGCQARVRETGAVMLWGEVSEINPAWSQGDLSWNLTADELMDLASVPQDRLGFATVEVTISGILRRLGQRSKPLRSSLYRLITSDNSYLSYLPHVYDYFPCEDGADATVLASGIPNEQRAPMTFDGDLKLASNTSFGEPSEPLPSVDESKFAHWSAQTKGFTDHGSVEVLFTYDQMISGPDSVFRPIDVYSTGTLARWSVEVTLYGGRPSLFLRVFGSDGGLVDWIVNDLSTSGLFFTGTPLQIRLDLDQSGGNVDWAVNWYSVTRNVDPGEGFGNTTPGTLGHVTAIGGGVGGAPPGGVAFGHYVVHDGLPAGWLSHGGDGWWLEPARTRFARLTLEENVPRVIPSGIDNRSHAMGVQRPSSLMDLLGECQDAEVGGILCEDRPTFALKFIHRRFRYNRAPVITLDAALSQIANPFQPVNDDQQIRNDVTAQRLDGTKSRAFDQPSIDRFGLYDEALTVNVASDLIVRHIAGWQLWLGGRKGFRYPQLTIDVAVAPQLKNAVKTLDVGDLIRVVNLPPQHPLGSVDLVVEGLTHNLSPFGFVTTINCSPGWPWQVGKWTTGRWGSLGSVLTSGIDADDTTFNVTVPGIAWTTVDADFPFDAVIGVYPDDEPVTVTDISGSPATQTFTVVRDPLFPRSHSAGAEVHPAAAILGL